MRARYPDTEGFVERDGVKVSYEVFGSGEPALVFAPTDPLVHSRAWKAQVPYLARTSRVVTIDPRGNGRSDRPESSAAYADTEYVADTIAVMDATGTDRAVLVGLCSSAWTSLLTAALHPDRVLGVVSIATWAPFLTPPSAVRAVYDFDEACDTDEGWAKENRHYWLRDWRGYVEFFFGELLPEPHSTKLHEDLVSWAMDTSAETNLLSVDAPFSSSSREDTEAILARAGRLLPAVRAQRAGRRAHRRRPADAGRCRARPDGPGARRGQSRHPGFRRPLPPCAAASSGPAHVDQAVEPAQAGALRLLAHRARPRPA